MVSGVFAVALSRMYIRIWCPTIQVPLPEVHNKNDQDQWVHSTAAFP